jgi:hypothetical protein
MKFNKISLSWLIKIESARLSPTKSNPYDIVMDDKYNTNLGMSEPKMRVLGKRLDERLKGCLKKTISPVISQYWTKTVRKLRDDIYDYHLKEQCKE